MNFILKLKAMKRYSLWEIEHESIYSVMAYKIKDTDSVNEVLEWMDDGVMNAASWFIDGDVHDAGTIQFFNQ